MIEGSKAREIRNYRIDTKTVKNNPQKIIDDIRGFADWYNRTIDRVIKAGVPKKYLPAGGAKIAKTGIRGIKSAERALVKIKNLAWSDIASPKDYKKLIRDAEEIYGKGKRYKLIKTPDGKIVAVPYGTNMTMEQPEPEDFDSEARMAAMISDYWDWYEQIGSFFFDSDEAMTVLNKALESGNDPVEFGKRWVRDYYSEMLESYADLFAPDIEAGNL